MNRYTDLLETLLSYKDEFEWLDFKENWFSKDEIGEYISAIANGAALCGREFGYIVWGVSDETKEVVGTTVNFNKDIDHEPYKHYLSRNLAPKIAFDAVDFEYRGSRVVILMIPQSKSVVTKFKGEAFIRIGSSKERLAKFPEWEVKLTNTLVNGYPTITNEAAPDYAQELTFERLFMYYGAKGLTLRKDTFEKTLKLKNKDGRYNVMAYILSDQNSIPVRVSAFSGLDKAAPLYSVKEFGNTCILYSLDKILEYGDAINIMQADERNRVSERKDVPLFDYEAYHEAILNAFIHNKWLTLNGPQISVFTDRIEILSHGGLALDQDVEGFYAGASIPVNEVLASIFLQLRIRERSGRGVPKIVSKYGRGAIRIEKNRVTVTIPFSKINVNSFEIVSQGVSQKVSQKVYQKVNQSQQRIIGLMRDNPNVTTKQLAMQTGLSLPAVKKNVKALKGKRLVERIGALKNGYWKVID